MEPRKLKKGRGFRYFELFGVTRIILFHKYQREISESPSGRDLQDIDMRQRDCVPSDVKTSTMVTSVVDFYDSLNEISCTDSLEVSQFTHK